MEGASSPERESLIKWKVLAESEDLRRKQENEEALRRFAELKVSARSANEEELRQVFSILHQWNVSQIYENRVPSLMPELIFFLQVISESTPSREILMENLPYIIDQIGIAKASYILDEGDIVCDAYRKAIIATVKTIKTFTYARPGAYIAYDNTSQEIRKKLNARWNPPYLIVLPEAVLCNIFQYLDMQAASNCIHICSTFRAIVLKVLNWRPIRSSRATPEKAIIEGISNLPNEILISIFEYLDTYTLQVCAATCQSWRQVAMNSPALWTGNVVLGGEPYTVDKQWTKILQLTRESKVKALSIVLFNGWENQSSHVQHVCLQSFPHDSLEHFSCDLGATSVLDEEVWTQLLECSRLKVLHITSDAFMCDSIRVPQDSNLAQCRLQDLKLHCYGWKNNDMYIIWDEVFFSMISKVKRLSLAMELQSKTLHRVLAVMKSTVQSLHLGGNVLMEDDYIDAECHAYSTSHQEKEQYWTSISMVRLRHFSGFLPCSIRIEAPLLEKLHLAVGPASNFDILKACSAHLKQFSCRFDVPSKIKADCLQDLLDNLDKLSACHTISFHVGRTERTWMGQWECGKVAASFWNTLLSSIDKFPALKHLSIGSDDQNDLIEPLDPEMLLAFIQAKRDSGFGLKSLRLIHLAHFSIESILKIQNAVPLFTYKMSRSDFYRRNESEGRCFDMYPPPQAVIYPEPEGVTRISSGYTHDDTPETLYF